MAQEERARSDVQDADDEDDHCWTEACEGIAKKMLKYLEASVRMSQVLILCPLRGRREMGKARSCFRFSDKEQTRSSSPVWRGGRND